MLNIESIQTLQKEISEKNSFGSQIQSQNAQILKINKTINILNDKITKKSAANQRSVDLESVKDDLNKIKTDIQNENEAKLNELKESIFSTKSNEVSHLKKTLSVLIKDYNSLKASNTSHTAEITLTINDLKSKVEALESTQKCEYPKVQGRAIQFQPTQYGIDQKWEEIKEDLGKQFQVFQESCNNSIQTLSETNTKLKFEVEQIKKQKNAK